MNLKIDENVESILEKLANSNGMFAPEFTRLVLSEMLKNEEHKEYYGKIAQKVIADRIKASDAYFARKYTPKNKKV